MEREALHVGLDEADLRPDRASRDVRLDDEELSTGRIYDVTGSHVADMTGGLVPNTLVWNGRSNGRIVGSGAYIYRIQGGGKTYTGTLVVAR